MSGGEISANIVSSASGHGGGVYVKAGSTFKKIPISGGSGIIYGTTGDGALRNRVTGGGPDSGVAVYVDGSPVKKRNITADENTQLDSTVDGSTGGWE
jgi:hypothetical protein